MIGREGELRRMRARWRRAAAGAGALVTLVGAYGMGKTRMAAEIARDAHREGAAVLYATGTGPPAAALAAIARARALRRPALVVLDDADRVPADVRAALRELAAVLGALPVLVLATGQEAAALARLEPHESVVLEPLDAASVHAIAGIYAPAGGHDTVPVETLLAMSRGVARRVHEAASAWARREATRRVDAVADRAAAGRSEARALEAELAGSVVELQSARERADLLARDDDDAEAPVVCPYKGLATFDSEDAEYFFGRERLVAELVARLVGGRLLAVVGPSGSGKSSVVRAGLLPALAGGVLPASEHWTQALIRPGEHPLHGSGARPVGSPTGGAAFWRSTSSRSCSPPARTSTSAASSSPRSSAPPAIATPAVSSCSPSAPTSTAAAPPTPSCRACSAPTTCSSVRCRARSCGARSSARRSASA